MAIRESTIVSKYFRNALQIDFWEIKMRTILVLWLNFTYLIGERKDNMNIPRGVGTNLPPHQ
jgi:hypothetical protein